MARVKEALESNDWAHTDAQDPPDAADLDGDDERDNLDPEDLGFGFDPADVEDLKGALWSADAQDGEDEAQPAEDEVARMEDMMRKLQAVREAGEGLPEAQRRRMAARAVKEVMREL
ncbi:hypothetical protein E4U42_007590 [Claviceps africana]|uniref:Uncharacterized protein n=1 Tax=Claviceps africana TaxID=83212 RepID=A0A8K0NG18_9HYPO|nr:hypothetical protein E4U42_007590 [Claviceps africana]